MKETMKNILHSMRFILSVAFVAIASGNVFAQQPGSLSPVLIGSAGNYSTGGNITLSSSTGECIVPTVQNSPFILTQGFQQPNANGALSLSTTVVHYNVTCAGAGDGAASVTVTGGTAPYTYVWSTGITDTLAVNDSLAPGTYSVTVTDAGNLSQTQTFVVTDGTEICDINFYNGITPNGDGQNDVWVIDYIELKQPNNVSIYDRWGYLVFSGDNYDNSSVVWNGTNQQGQKLPDGTYFFVITIGEASTRGWVELTN
jgi:gliding motility-associated-like protein